MFIVLLKDEWNLNLQFEFLNVQMLFFVEKGNFLIEISLSVSSYLFIVTLKG